MKRVVCIFLSFAIMLSLLTFSISATSAKELGLSSVSHRTNDDIVYNILPDNTAEVYHYLGSDTELTIPSVIDGHTVSAISDGAFELHNTLKKLVIPETVTRIGRESFFNCKNLTQIVIPDSVSYIGDNSFIMTPWSGELVGDIVYINNVLYSCNSTLEENAQLKVREGTVSISPRAFFNQKNLKSIELPDSLESIGDEAFYGCSALESIFIPASVKEIGEWAFGSCGNLETIAVSENNPYYDSRENSFAIIETKTDTLLRGCNKTVIPESIKAIGPCSFDNCEEITSVVIPSDVLSIDDYAFSGCKNLKDVEIKGSGVEIADRVFENTLFYENLPSGLNYLGDILLCYKGDMPINSHIEIKEGTKSIAGNAFYGYTNLVSVKIPDSVESIGDAAFCYCYNLKSVEMSYTVKTIGDYAFCGCSKIEYINFSEYLEKIGDAAFYDCMNAKFSPFCYNVKELGDSAFSNCENLETIEFGYNGLTIERRAFADCSSLKNVEFHSPVKSIGRESFKGCVSLKQVAVDAENIDRDAFSECDTLEGVCLYNPDTNIEYWHRVYTFTKATLYGYNNSSAQEFADFYKYNFVSLGEAPILGDVDGDNEVAIIDATIIQKSLTKSVSLTLAQQKRADTDKDCEITIMDATNIQRLLAQIISSF